FIVSRVELLNEKPGPRLRETEIPGLAVEVKASDAEKCERCWINVDSVGANPEQPHICQRCDEAIQA
ncbi:MAG: hypothetical protein JRD68_16470, partial [Deltaproteobacteria bacterium]|nr:hypothetical protein [Deltaproteobacteria bacterium]